MSGNYRSRFIERDRSSFVKAQTNEVGAMVIDASKGPYKPVKCQNEDDVLTYFGNPSATYPEVFEALAFVSQSPCWIASAHAEDVKWGGVHVFSGIVEAFSAGQDDPENYVFTSVNVLASGESIGTGDGTTTNFSGTLNNTPVDAYSIIVKSDGTANEIADSDGVFSGDDIGTGTNTIDYTTGDYDFDFATAPTSGVAITVDYGYEDDLSSTISHSFFARSPYDDDLKVLIENISGSQFKLTLYQTVSGNDVYITEYNYSLIREKNNFGKQLYILDVFDNNKYLIPKLNSDYSQTTPSLNSTTAVALDGGYRGDSSPTTADYTTGWNYYKSPTKYNARIFMDCAGNSQSTINTIINSYQFYSHGISVVPMGNDAADAVSFRSSLGLNSDNVSLYTNWRKIYDPYNDGYAWISNVGSIGKKYAQMEDVYDGLSPAGIDENNHGGLISDWQTIEMEYDYTEGSNGELYDLDNAQVNPVVFDEIYGVKIYGDKTLQSSLSDTSYTHTRRIYNYILEAITKQVLVRQEFKNNDSFHRLKAQTMTETFLTPILAQELLSEIRVICDTSNNTSDVLDRRDFILDIIVKATPNSQQTLLRLTKVSQSDSVNDVIVSTL